MHALIIPQDGVSETFPSGESAVLSALEVFSEFSLVFVFSFNLCLANRYTCH